MRCAENCLFSQQVFLSARHALGTRLHSNQGYNCDRHDLPALKGSLQGTAFPACGSML